MPAGIYIIILRLSPHSRSSPSSEVRPGGQDHHRVHVHGGLQLAAYFHGTVWRRQFNASLLGLERVLLELYKRIPLVVDAAQAKIATSRLKREATGFVNCILSQKDKFA